VKKVNDTTVTTRDVDADKGVIHFIRHREIDSCLSKYIASEYYWRIVMSKEKKGNKESKKPKKESDGTKKQKKDPKRHDGL
jgi:predicted nuclease of restriction endonuclease-like (RecB) superfamily